MTRLAHFAFRPESWAEALRFPLRYSLVPLVLAIVLAGVVTGTAFGIRIYRYVANFANGYDAVYAPMEYKDGKLSVLESPIAGRPIQIDTAGGGMLVIDPTGQTKPEDLKEQGGVLISQTTVYQCMFGQVTPIPLKEFPIFADLPDGTRIDGAFLRREVQTSGRGYAAIFGIMFCTVSVIANTIWSALMIFAAAPVVVIAAAGLRLRYRTAYRVVAAVLVPLVLLGALLIALGLNPAQTMRPEFVPIFWFAATLILAVWAGILAGRMFRPRKTESE